MVSLQIVHELVELGLENAGHEQRIVDPSVPRSAMVQIVLDFGPFGVSSKRYEPKNGSIYPRLFSQMFNSIVLFFRREKEYRFVRNPEILKGARRIRSRNYM